MRERRRPDPARSGSARGRIAAFDQLRAQVALENAAAQGRADARLRGLIEAFERNRSRDTAVALIEASWPISIPDEQRPRCRNHWCGRRMAVDRFFSGFAWRCRVGHTARPIDPLKVADFIRAHRA
ncbi:MAG: hypothetical protein JWO85_2250 [Candidatus Eremiobacteraeota bacterium]|nr:hypothetical protein [Candidatus Eremiobacteraeota bacterium]